MFRSTLVIIASLAFSSSAIAVSFIPVHLAAVDAQARTFVVKKYLELTSASGSQIYVRNLESAIGKYGSDFGDFRFSGEIWISNQRKFRCATRFVRAGFDQVSGEFTINTDDLNSTSQCTEVPATEF